MMPAGSGSGPAKLEIAADCLLLVEGRDEVNLFNALFKHCLDNIHVRKIQVIEAGGVNNFPNSLRAIKAAGQARPTLRSIGIVRDADCDAVDAFASVCRSLNDIGYVPPSAHGQFSKADPAIGVFIVPDGVNPGAIESLCRSSRAGDAISGCVEEYMKCLFEHKALQSTNADKSFAHAYLAAMNNPVSRVGEGALQGAWNFDSEAFSDLKTFLQNLFAHIQ